MTELSRRQFLSAAGKTAVAGLATVPAISLLASCAGQTPSLNLSTLQSAIKVGKAVSKTFEDITPEQEYYIGRTISAVILDKYKPYNNQRANDYVNVLGQTLARASDLPETFGGYHFLIQDSDDINALSAPGGFIFITRGLLRCCKSEEAAAAVLAHEVGHVQHRHGLQAIKKSRVTSALTTIGVEGAKQFGSGEVASLTTAFEGSIKDITSALINSGYSRSFERQADEAAVSIMKRVGYDPNGLLEMLGVMDERLKPGGLDFAKTHPSPKSRMADVEKMVAKAPLKTAPARQRRFSAALGKV